MLRALKFLFFLFLLLFPDWVAAQDTLIVKEVIVHGNRGEEFNAGVKSETIDSAVLGLYQYANLSSLLEQNASLYIKSYGLGSLSTMSFRGASASQTSVLWNGFALQSPMNGLLDLALVPVSFVDQLKVQFGGCGALWGSGSVSGSIHLDNALRYNTGLSTRIGMGYGSYQSLSPSADITWSSNKMITSVKAFLTKADNNFTYLNTAKYDSPKEKQTNAQLQQYGYMWDNYLKLNSKTQLSFRVWQQYSDRGIPPTMVSGISDANQKDWFIRLSSEWQHARKLSTWNIRVAYFNENLHYKEVSSNIDSHNKSISLISEAETKLVLLKNGLLNLGVHNTYGEAIVDSYVGVPHQNRAAIFSSLKYSGKWYRINAGVRKEVVTGTRYDNPLEVPLMPFAGLDIKVKSKLVLKSNISRNYRLPTFNDLYWTPGGNINLKPEQGWSEEFGWHFTHINEACTGENCKPDKIGLAEFKYSSTIFNRNIDNWIMWVPDGAYWLPKNVLKVWSRGVENSVSVSWKIKRVKLNFGARYDYVLSTNERVPIGSENDLGKQLIYVPLHKANLNAGIEVKGYSLRYAHIYTGWVYTLSDNESFIDPYWLGNISLSKRFTLKKNALEFLAKVNNVWNENYQVIALRAMPRRNFEIGINVQLNTK